MAYPTDQKEVCHYLIFFYVMHTHIWHEHSQIYLLSDLS